MGRKTVYNKLTNQESLSEILQENKNLQEDFLNYLSSIDRSPQTIKQYRSDLNIFFVWNLKFNDNKPFVKIKKRELIRWQSYALYELKWSSKRLRRVKSVISSLSNYIENILDEEDEYEDFRSIVKKIESPENVAIREKTVFTDEEVQFLLDTLVSEEKYEKACAVAICAFSGMRKSELLQMKLSYFDNTRLINNGSMYITDKIRSKGRGKQGKQINKYILVGVKKYIDLWRQQRQELRVDIDDMFVVYDKGTWKRRETIDSWCEEFSNIVGKPFYFHSLRHYLTTKLTKANIPTEVIRAFFEWNDVQMVSYYCDIDMADEFDKYFSSEGVIKQDDAKL